LTKKNNLTVYSKIILKHGKEAPVLRFHPWIFSGAIHKITGEVKNGDIVEVFSNKDAYLATGHYQTGSIAVRVFCYEQQEINFAFWKLKLQNAFQLRKQLNLTNTASTNVYRLVHGEGDDLPGLIVDYYNGSCVIQSHSAGMHIARTEIANALKDIVGEKLNTVYYKSAESFSKTKDQPSDDNWLLGNKSETIVKENNFNFHVNWAEGQKTGFFIDQRENRMLLSKYAEGKSVLNLFSYTGGFSVYAAKSGAAKVHSVDSSKKAIELCDKNIQLNNVSSCIHESFCEDAIQYLKSTDDQYDLIILDPPAFAKHLDAKRNAINAYKQLNADAMRKIKKSGIIFTFSCSQVIDKYLFQSTVISAAILVGRKVKILHQLTQAADHPVSAFHPEGEYLKGLVLFVE